MSRSTSLLALLLCGAPALAAAAGDPTFDARYGASLVRKGPLAPLEWTTGPEHVWRISGLEFVRGGELSFVVGEATLVLGVHGENPLWAVILPDQPAPISGRTAAAGSLVSAAWLRFHPREFRELFPSTRVTGQGPARALLAARRIAAHKLGSSWQADGFPALPDPGAWVLDCDTTAGPRRFLAIDGARNSIQYMAAFERRTLPPGEPLDAAAALAAFDRTWSRFDAVYAKFALRPEVDWDAVRATWRPLAEGATTTWEAGTAIGLALETLRDLHAWVQVDGEFCAPYQRVRPANVSFAGTQAVLGASLEPARQIAHGRTKDGVGYIASLSLADESCVEAFDEALEALGDCWALVLDLRMNGGGNEALAQRMAGRFADKPRVYSHSQVRADPAERTKLGPKTARTLEPRGPWRWGQPVAVLQGRRTMSSAESFVAMMAALPTVTTMGDATAGSSGNPELLDCGHGIVVSVPRWNDLDAAGKPIEDVGLPPKVRFQPQPASFTSEADGLVSAALEHLRKQSKGVRRAGKPAKK
ncbi:MAG: hypothetical protein JNK02_13310 [Planctomycetes bacterium]|nr:hypothetical protein [Planctomycetota bacterium]